MNGRGRSPALLAAGAALAAAAGCANVRGANPELAAWVHRPAGVISIAYSRSLVAPARREGEPYEVGQPELDLAGRRVFVGSSDRGLYALGAATGDVLWRFETMSFVQCAPLYDPIEDVVYFGSNDGALYKVRARDGELVWRFSTNSEVARKPSLEGGRVIFTNANDTVLAVDAKTGALAWHQHRSPALGMEVASHSGALVWRGKVYAGFSDGVVTAYDARTGEERWQPVDLSAEAEQNLGDVPQFLDVDTTPVADELSTGPVVYVGSYASGVYALDAENGTQVWANPAVEGTTRVLAWSQPEHLTRDGRTAPARHLVIVSTGTTGLWGLDPETGRDVWHQPMPSGGVGGPVPWQGALLVSATTLGVFLVSPLDGGVIDGLDVSEGVTMTAAAHGARAFVMTNSGRFLSLVAAPPG